MLDGRQEETTELCIVPLLVRGHVIKVPRLVATQDVHEVVFGEPFLAQPQVDLCWQTRIASWTIGKARVKVLVDDCD
jgi:hypothetical protein